MSRKNNKFYVCYSKEYPFLPIHTAFSIREMAKKCGLTYSTTASMASRNIHIYVFNFEGDLI